MTSGLYIGIEESGETDRAGIWDNAESDSSESSWISLDGTSEQHLPHGTAASDSWLEATKEGFIDLHITTQPVTAGAHHH